ncbi:FlhC family transcriptional regulator [Aquabacterium humicola]|uniref:FlhC family transcriptional regulator n=1 Tax=Aquabacterium humicola TaxID=3237377 RepID=UPI002542C66A|nr:FlhC family transcriptional regulator [Rubrivivax pictus]
MESRVDRQLRALRLAKACAAHGARVRTICHLTGMPPREVLRLFFEDRSAVPRGRPPDSPEWYHTANLLYRADASIVMSMYGRLRAAGFGGGDSLVGAYGQYNCISHGSRRISFDRAFDLASHTEGIWLTRAKSFSLVACPSCRSEFLASYGTIASSNDPCPFCKLVERFRTDPRVQASYPVRPLVVPSPRQLGLMALLGAGRVERQAQAAEG